MGKNVGKQNFKHFFRNHMARDGSLSRNCPTKLNKEVILIPLLLFGLDVIVS